MNIQKRTALAPSSLNWEDLSKSYFYFPTCQCDTLGVYRKSAGCDHQDPRKGEEISPEQREAGPCRWSLPTKEKPKATSNSPCNGNNKAEYELNLLRERAENNSWLTSPESGASQRLVPGSDGNTTKTAPAVSGDCRGRENQQLFETLSSDAQVQPRLPNPTFFSLPTWPHSNFYSCSTNFLSANGHKHNSPTTHKTSVTSQVPREDLSSGLFQKDCWGIRGNLG